VIIIMWLRSVIKMLRSGFPLVGVPASLTPENHAGTPNFGMPGVHWTPKNGYIGVLTN